jgi:copper transport protein
VRCSGAREALSAWADGESGSAKPLDISTHLATCADCAAYAEGMGDLSDLIGPLRRYAETTLPTVDPSLLDAVSSTSALPRRSWYLRLGIAALGIAELVIAMSEFLAEHGYGGEDHAGHESLSFTLALCAGLLWIVWRPAYARSYLPIVGVAATLLTVTAVLDVTSGRARLVEELPHLGLVVAFVLLWLLSRDRPRSPSGQWSAQPGRGSDGVAQLRFIRGTLRSLAVVAILAVIVVAAPAWGHATLQSSNPVTSAILKKSPSNVRLRFSEAVTTLPGSLEVYGPDGRRVDDGAIDHPGGNGFRVSVGVDGHQRGTYLVSWRVISADSHPVSGAFTFSVGKRSAAPTTSAAQTDPTVAAALGASRWLGYVGATLAIGGVAFLVICWPQGWSSARARRMVGWGFIAMTISTLSGLVLKGPYDAALGLTEITHAGLLREVLDTTYGGALLERLALVLLAAGFVGLRTRMDHRIWLPMITLLGVGILATYAVAGHATSDHPRWLAILVDTAHVGAMSIWFGGLLYLIVFVLRAPGEADVAPHVVSRFSGVALSAVAVLVASGTYQAWRQTGSLDALSATAYGRELLIKLGLVALVLAVAAASRRWVRNRSCDLRALRQRVSLEAMGIVVILGLTSALVATEPAKSAYHPSVSANLVLGPDTVQVSAVPAGDRRMQVHLAMFGSAQVPTEPAAVRATISLPSENIGPLPLKLTTAGRGHRTADIAVPVVGTWTLAVVVRTSPIDEFSKTVSLPIH